MAKAKNLVFIVNVCFVFKVIKLVKMDEVNFYFFLQFNNIGVLNNDLS